MPHAQSLYMREGCEKSKNFSKSGIIWYDETYSYYSVAKGAVGDDLKLVLKLLGGGGRNIVRYKAFT